MRPNGWSRAFLIAALMVVLGMGAVPGLAATQAPPSPGVTAEQARDLVAVLNDPARRKQLIGELEALEKIAPPATAGSAAAPAAAPSGAVASPAAAPAASSHPSSAVARAVSSNGLLSQVAMAVPAWAEGLFGQFASLRRLLAGIPASWNWLTQTAGDQLMRQYVMHIGLGLVMVVVPAALAWFVLRWLLRPRRVRLGALAARDPPAGAAPVVSPKLSGRLWGAARRFALALLAFIIDVAPVGAFAAIGTLLAPMLTDPGAPQVVVLGVVHAFAVFGTVLCIVRVAFAPDVPALRLVRLSDEQAAAVVRWIGWLQGIAVFGTTTLHAALLLGLDPAAELALQKLLLLVDHVLLVVIVLRNRQAVAAHLRAPKRRSGVLAGVLTGLAEVWHIVAVFLIMGMWLIWALDWHGGFTMLLRFIVTALLVGTVTRLLTAGLMIVLRHVLGVPDPNGGGESPFAFAMTPRVRAARYYPVLRAGISLAMSLAGLLVLLELSGVSSIGWLLGTTLGRQMFSAAVSIIITLGVAVVAWEGANVAFDRHLDRLSRQAQLARVTRIRTLLPMLRTALAIAILLVVGLTTLSQIGVNIAPLLAGAGIVGVAIGFGSQKLVQDLITGLFLLLEDAMQVGDWVTLAGVSGTVETLSIRTIRLRAGDGSMHIIPFSSVTMVNNTNRGQGNASVSVTVAAREDTDAVGEVLKAIVADMRQDPAFKPMILGDLQLWGVDKIDGSSATLAGQIVCTAGGRWGVQREFNRRYKKRFAELGIEIPNPTQTLLLRQEPPPAPASPSAQAASASRDEGQTTATVAASPPTS